MDENENVYSQMLGELYSQRDKIEAAITALEALSGVAPAGSSSGVSLGAPPGNAIREDTFFGMSMTEAIVTCLKIMKKPLKTREIGSLIKDGGYTSTAKRFNDVVYAGIKRLVKKGTVVHLEEQKRWGLKEWYPGSRTPPKPTAPENTDVSEDTDAEGAAVPST